jgi:aspartyl-tRNA(Asn)/glutamyl-tRNA(Gln) amidotransferase subunit A
MNDILKLTAIEISEKYKKKELSCTEVTKAFLARTINTNKDLNSFVSICEETALETAKKVDEKIAKSQELKLLEGVPIAIKDNMCTDGIQTTCCSKILHNFIPSYDATVIEKIKNNNMPILGKTNMDEFAMGSSTETSFFGSTKNPWDTKTVPGGSSGGSAVAVSALQAPLALGSDTGGSIRQPASFCGIVGMKPTYGVVSRYGLIAFASSLDQIGPFSKNIDDSAALLSVISGHDPKDSTSQTQIDTNYTKLDNPKEIKIGLPKEFFANLDSKTKELYQTIITKLSNEGIILEETELPSLEQGISTYYIIAPAEASSNLARFDGVRYGYRNEEAKSLVDMMELSRSEGFGAEVKRRILIGTYVLSSGYYDAYYKKAQQVRTIMKNDFQKAFNKYDVLISPTTPTPPFSFGSKSNPLEMYMNDIMTIPVNLAGIPALSMPCGMVNGLPMGLHLMGNLLEDKKLFSIAKRIEKILGFNLQNPYWEI